MSPDPSDKLSCQKGQVSTTVLQCSEDAEIKSQCVSQSVTELLQMSLIELSWPAKQCNGPLRFLNSCVLLEDVLRKDFCCGISGG